MRLTFSKNSEHPKTFKDVKVGQCFGPHLPGTTYYMKTSQLLDGRGNVVANAIKLYDDCLEICFFDNQDLISGPHDCELTVRCL